MEKVILEGDKEKAIDLAETNLAPEEKREFRRLLTKRAEVEVEEDEVTERKKRIGGELTTFLFAHEYKSIRVDEIGQATYVEGSARQTLSVDLLKVQMLKAGIDADVIKKVIEASYKTGKAPEPTVRFTAAKEK